MQKITVGAYTVIMLDEPPPYTRNSADNLPSDRVIDFGVKDYRTISLSIDDGAEERNMVMLIPLYSPTVMLPASRNIFFVFDTVLRLFNPANAEIVAEKDMSACGRLFAAYPYEDDFILHSETTIFRIKADLSVVWEFSAKDIFVRYCSSDGHAFEMKSDRICLWDFSDNYYEIDYDGKIMYQVQGEQTARNVL